MLSAWSLRLPWLAKVISIFRNIKHKTILSQTPTPRHK